MATVKLIWVLDRNANHEEKQKNKKKKKKTQDVNFITNTQLGEPQVRIYVPMLLWAYTITDHFNSSPRPLTKWKQPVRGSFESTS